MPANTPYELQTDVLRGALARAGITGITIDPAIYPDDSDALIVANGFLNALQSAQLEQNAATTAGERVQAVIKTVSRNEQTEDPPGSGNFLTTRPAVYTVSFNEVVAVTDVVPNRA